MILSVPPLSLQHQSASSTFSTQPGPGIPRNLFLSSLLHHMGICAYSPQNKNTPTLEVSIWILLLVP